MKSFYSLYNDAIATSINNKGNKEANSLCELSDYNEHHIDCLFHPDKHPPIIRVHDCGCSDKQKKSCDDVCQFNAISRDDKGNIVISDNDCVGCAICVDNCKSGVLTDRKDIIPILELLNDEKIPVYAMIAPAFISQFSQKVTPGRLRSAFKKLGFEGMLEVALFADILTLKEALEFDRYIQNDDDFMLTSCCCPIWIAMIKNIYKQFVPRIPPSVSPMVACGRAIKILHPEAKTVFIGPCVAKKAERKEKDIADAVDYVLTFQEVEDIFNIAKIDPSELDEDLRDHSSAAGRIYARTGGVSEAVQNTVNRLKPNRTIPLKAKQANGAAQCKALLNEMMNGKIDANFIEGMGCVGGCVGGPKALINKDDGTKQVNRYAGEAIHETPVDNPYVIELLERLGFNSIETLIEKDNIFIRDFMSDNKQDKN